MDSTVNDNMFVLSKDYLVKKANVKLLSIAAVLLVAGIALIVLSRYFNEPKSIFYTLSIIGICVFGFAVVLMLAGKKSWLTKDSGSKVEKVNLYFDDKDTFGLTSDMEKRNFASISKYEARENSGLRLISLVSSDGSFAAIRLEKYIPYTFEHLTETIIATGDEAAAICVSIKKLKK